MKKVAISGVLSTLLVMPVLGFEVYDNDDKKVDLYGSIRGYVGMGYHPSVPQGASNVGYLFGIQNNSTFGVRVQMDKFKANVEFGAVESGIDGKDGSTGYRQYWGSYDTGVGTFLFGKTNTPSIDNGFSSDWINHDGGSQGNGGIAAAKRKIQLQYNIAGVSMALVEDEMGQGRDIKGKESPRISVGYTINDEKGNLLFKVAASYKYYNSSLIRTDVPKGTDAYHIFLGYKPTFGKQFVSIMTHYGKNGHLYGEQMTTYSTGSYMFSNADSAIGLNAQRVGLRLEFGTKITEDLSFILGGGYQATFDGKNQVSSNSGVINNYSAFVQLPYKVSKNFTLAPQVSFYETFANEKSSTLINGKRNESGLIAGARIRWDF